MGLLGGQLRPESEDAKRRRLGSVGLVVKEHNNPPMPSTAAYPPPTNPLGPASSKIGSMEPPPAKPTTATLGKATATNPPKGGKPSKGGMRSTEAYRHRPTKSKPRFGDRGGQHRDWFARRHLAKMAGPEALARFYKACPDPRRGHAKGN